MPLLDWFPIELVSLATGCRFAAQPSEDLTQIHKHAQHITGDLKVTAQIYNIEHASASEHYVQVTLKKTVKKIRYSQICIEVHSNKKISMSVICVAQHPGNILIWSGLRQLAT